MRLTTRGRYAVTSMLDLALHQGEGPIPLAGISERQDISLSYLEQLFSQLRRNGLSEPGIGGLIQVQGAGLRSVSDWQCAGRQQDR